MSIGGTGAVTGGAGGAGAAGMGAGASGTGGFGNPQAGAGGIGMATGGSGAGMGGAGGGAGTGPVGGMGGVGGMSAGMGGEPIDGGVTEPEAPSRDCEDSREVLQLSEVIGAFPLTCMMEAPAGTLMDGPFSLAVTTAREGSSAETAWSDRKASSDACGQDASFYVDNSLGIPRLVLCPALCEALLTLSDEASQDAAMTVTVEIIYGCEPPQ